MMAQEEGTNTFGMYPLLLDEFSHQYRGGPHGNVIHERNATNIEHETPPCGWGSIFEGPHGESTDQLYAQGYRERYSSLSAADSFADIAVLRSLFLNLVARQRFPQHTTYSSMDEKVHAERTLISKHILLRGCRCQILDVYVDGTKNRLWLYLDTGKTKFIAMFGNIVGEEPGYNLLLE